MNNVPKIFKEYLPVLRPVDIILRVAEVVVVRALHLAAAEVVVEDLVVDIDKLIYHLIIY